MNNFGRDSLYNLHETLFQRQLTSEPMGGKTADEDGTLFHTDETQAFVAPPMGGNADELTLSAPIPNFYRTTSRFVEELASQHQNETSSIVPSKLTDHPDDHEGSSLLPSSHFCQDINSSAKANQGTTNTQVVGKSNVRLIKADINRGRSSNLKNTLPQIVFRIRIMNLIVSTSTLVCMIFTLWLKIFNATKFILSIYCMFGSLLLCFYELHLSSTDRILQDKFGLLFSPHGRAAYVIFLGALCLTQGLFPFIFGICLISNGLHIAYVIFKYPDYVTADQTSAGRQDIRDIATQRVGEWAVPAWARPVAETTAAMQGGIGKREGATYGTIPSDGDTLLFSDVKEVVDLDQEQLLERQQKFQGVKTNISSMLGKINFDACLPKSKRSDKVFEDEDDDIGDEGDDYGRLSFIR